VLDIDAQVADSALDLGMIEQICTARRLPGVAGFDAGKLWPKGLLHL
jgi:hypothetical protein